MDLKRFITDVPNFPKAGILFRDISPLLAAPEAFSYVIGRLCEARHGTIDAIAALDARGFFFGSPLALQLGVPLVPIRKKGKLPQPKIGRSYTLEYGTDTVEMKHGIIKPSTRVLVVDDLLATGGTASAACELIESVDARVVECAFVIELVNEHGRERLHPRRVSSLVQY